MQESCPCLSGELFDQCCQPLLEGRAKADSPEQLMRSRYSAFQQKNVAYLLATLHPSQHQADEEIALRNNIENTHWLGLKVLAAKQSGDSGEVQFAAFFSDGDGVGQLHERSQFVRESGNWFYTTGEMLKPYIPGRNDACWCGSGKKFKKCHGQ